MTRDRQAPRRLPGLDVLSTQCSLPGSLLAVLRELDDDLNSNYRTLAAAIGKDVDLAASIMTLANSALYDTCAHKDACADLESAIRSLGRHQVFQIVLRQGIALLGRDARELGAQIATHLCVVAEIARVLGGLKSHELGELAFVCGLLHDYGKLVLLKADPALYRSLVDRQEVEGSAVLAAERSLFTCDFAEHADHVQVGAALLRHMGLDEQISKVVASHHEDYRHHVQAWNSWTLTGIVIVADDLAHGAGYADRAIDDRRSGHPLDPSLRYHMDRPSAQLDAIVRQAVQDASMTLEAARFTAGADDVREGQDGLRRRSMTRENSEDRSGFRVAVPHRHAPSTRGSVPAGAPGREPGVNEQDVDLPPQGALAGRARAIVTPEQAFLQRDLAWSPDGRHLAMVCKDRRVRTWNAGSSEMTAESGPLPGAATCGTWSRDGVSFAVGSDDGTVQVLEGERLRLQRTIAAGDAGVYAVAWSPDSQRIAIGTTAGEIQVWDVRNDDASAGHPLVLGDRRSMVTAVAWAPDGHLLAGASASGTITLWRTSDWQVARELRDHHEPVWRISWSPRGGRFASASEDGTIRIWDPGQDASVKTLRRHGAPVVRVSYSHDGRYVASMSRDGHVCVWSCESWDCAGQYWATRDDAHFHLCDGGLSFHPHCLELACADQKYGTVVALELVPAPAVSMRRQDELPGPHPPPTRLLQLSDLHFGPLDTPDEKLNHLLSDLSSMGRRRQIDFVVVSGDLVNRAVKEEFNNARRFVEELLADLGLDRSRCIVAPGNHDLSCDQLLCQRESVLADDACACICRPNGVRIALPAEDYPNRLRNFSRYLWEPLYGEPYPLAFADQCVVRAFPAQRIEFVTYNSAWNVVDCHKDRVSIHPGALAAAEARRLPEADAASPGASAGRDAATFTVGIWHHPVALGRQSIDGAQFLPHLARAGVRLGLHGHLHQVADGSGVQYGEETCVIGVGSFGADRQNRPEAFPQQYQLLEIAADRETVTVHSRRKTHSISGEWDADCIWPARGGSTRAATHTFALQGVAAPVPAPAGSR